MAESPSGFTPSEIPGAPPAGGKGLAGLLAAGMVIFLCIAVGGCGSKDDGRPTGSIPAAARAGDEPERTRRPECSSGSA